MIDLARVSWWKEGSEMFFDRFLSPFPLNEVLTKKPSPLLMMPQIRSQFQRFFPPQLAPDFLARGRATPLPLPSDVCGAGPDIPVRFCGATAWFARRLAPL